MLFVMIGIVFNSAHGYWRKWMTHRGTVCLFADRLGRLHLQN